MNEYLKSGRQALRLLYFLIISYSITKSLSILFTSGNEFSLPTFDKAVLFGIFFSFITRFFLGAYRVLSEDIDIELRRPKIIVDIIGFFIQALLFYVYSLNFYDSTYSQWMIILICAIDLLWLALLAFRYQIKASTYVEWIVHNMIVIGFAAYNILSLHSTTWLFALAMIAFIVDFWFNGDFYFSRTQTGLRIFVAGPYGDNQPAEVIDKNVKAARDVGKELALRGHFPFIPHTMLHGWETDHRFTIHNFKAIDLKWLEFCDALYFIGPSVGANEERQFATRKGLQVFESLDEVPHVNSLEKTRRS